MSAAELLTTVVIVTILVTVLLLGTSYLGRRLESGRRPKRSGGRTDESRYFVRFQPESGDGESD